MKIENVAAWKIIPELYDKGYTRVTCSYSGRVARYCFKACVKTDPKMQVYVGLDSAANFMIEGIDAGDEAAWISQERTKLKSEARGKRLRYLISFLQKNEPEYNFKIIWYKVKNQESFSPSQFLFIIGLALKHGYHLDNDIVLLDLKSYKNKDLLGRYPQQKIDTIKKNVPKRQVAVIEKLRLNNKY